MTDLTDPQRVERGRRAQRAIDEFFEPALAKVQATFAKRLQDLCIAEPWASDKIASAAHVVRIADILKADLLTLVNDGEHAAQSIIDTERYDQLTPARRRLVAIGAR